MVKFDFNTKPQFVKRNGRKILGIYREEKLARKMTKAHQVLRRPPGLTIDAEAYDTHVAGNNDWTIVFDISDGRRFWITAPEFNKHRKYIDRGQGPQWVIEFRYLHQEDDCNASSGINKSDQPKAFQLSLSLGGQT